MRISNNNCNEEEKEYWSEWGQKIFQFSYNNSPLIFKEAELYNASQKAGIPTEIIEDYIKNRKRNFEVNKLYLQWKQEGVFDTLIFSKDDCAEHGFNVEEARAIENLGGKTKTGADEIPLSLLARAIKKEIRVFVKYLEPDYKNCISNYEDISIEKSVLGQLELGGFTSVKDEAEADIILIVNNFVEKQGELVMGWDTPGKFKNNFIEPEKPYAVADVRYANGADNDFIEYFLPKINLKNFYGYSGWNTSANTLGSLLAAIKVKWNAKKYNDDAFKRLEMIRFLDDWAYQANIRTRITEPVGISDLMRPYEDKIAEVLKIKSPQSISYTYPWNRKFEIRVNIKTA